MVRLRSPRFHTTQASQHTKLIRSMFWELRSTVLNIPRLGDDFK